MRGKNGSNKSLLEFLNLSYSPKHVHVISYLLCNMDHSTISTQTSLWLNFFFARHRIPVHWYERLVSRIVMFKFLFYNSEALLDHFRISDTTTVFPIQMFLFTSRFMSTLDTISPCETYIQFIRFWKK